MRFSKQINNIRARVMRVLTKHIGRNKIEYNGGINENEIKRILLCRPNHRLGNLLLVTPLLQDVRDKFPYAKIDLFVKGGIAPTLFKNFYVSEFIQLPKRPFANPLKYFEGWLLLAMRQYDLVINVVPDSSSGRLSVKFANGRLKSFGDLNKEIISKYADHNHMAKAAVYNFRNIVNSIGKLTSESNVPSVELRLSHEELSNGRNLVSKLLSKPGKTICLFTFATGKKCYSVEWWVDLYEKLLMAFPDVNIVEVLPMENVSQISRRAPLFYTKDVRELAAFIANTDIFIGADSGVMHLASAVRTTTIGLFKVTNPDRYAPYNNRSFAIDTGTISIDEIIKRIEIELPSIGISKK